MAKRQSRNKPPVVNVNTNVTQSVNAWDSEAFAKLLQEQALANETSIKNLEMAMSSAGANQQQLAEQIEQSALIKDIRDLIFIQLEDSRIEKEHNAIREKSLALKEEELNLKQKEKEKLKEANEQLKEQIRLRAVDAQVVTNVANSMKTFRTVGERVRDSFSAMASKFSGGNIRKTLLSATNIAGFNNRRIAREDFIQQQKALGVKGSREELKEKFEGAQSAKKQIDKNEADIRDYMKTSRLSEDQLSKTERGRELLEKRAQAGSEYSKFDAKAGIVSSGALSSAPMTNIQPMTPSTAAQSAGESQEAQIEASRKMSLQTELLQKIEENTRGAAPDQKANPSPGGGGGLFGGIGRGLMGMSKGLTALTPAIPVIGVLTLAAIGLGKALQLAAPAIEAFAPVLMKLVEVIGGVVIAAIQKLPEIFQAVGDVVVGIISAISDGITGIIDSVTSSIERLAAIDGSNLLSVGAGLVAVAGGLAAFGAGSAVAGVSNLVGGLLGAITPGGGPVEQILKLGESGPNIEKAGIGVEKLAGGLKAFSGIDTEKIKAIAALPVEKIAAMGAAMQTPAAGVAAGSAQNDAARMAAQAAGGGGQTNVVNAPVNNVTQQTNLIKSPIRNQESSQSRYLNSRWAVV
jgi:hypothetical protein